MAISGMPCRHGAWMRALDDACLQTSAPSASQAGGIVFFVPRTAGDFCLRTG